MLWNLFDELWGTDPSWWRGPVLGRRSGLNRPFPAINAYGNDEKILLTSEIPGLNTDDLEISVHGRSMTVKGSRIMTDLGEEEFYATHERNHGEFSRTVTLPYEVDADKVEARYENGVLTIEMPRAEVDKPRKIKVKAA